MSSKSLDDLKSDRVKAEGQIRKLTIELNMVMGAKAYLDQEIDKLEKEEKPD